jgi:Asp-tRNA(Asn)/Glu-tRNA(Gln) amidotransferase A subunit family amidase
MLGIPTISIPVLAEQDLPLGLQVLGFENCDADVFSIAGALMERLPAKVRA